MIPSMKKLILVTMAGLAAYTHASAITWGNWNVQAALTWGSHASSLRTRGCGFLKNSGEEIA
jgi:hypothetical protein